GSTLRLPLAVPAAQSEWKCAEARHADELVAFLAEAIAAVGQPRQGVLDLVHLLGPPIHQRHLDLRVQGLRGMDRHVREARALGRAALRDDGAQRPLDPGELVPEELFQFRDDAPIELHGAHADLPSAPGPELYEEEPDTGRGRP